MEYEDWFLASMDEWRTSGYHCTCGNIPGAPGAEVFRSAYEKGLSPTQALLSYQDAERTFLQTIEERT
jgi:hypothetical protein